MQLHKTEKAEQGLLPISASLCGKPKCTNNLLNFSLAPVKGIFICKI